ncbi:MAG: hypothetical protein M3321_00115 [Actinomycetota bacterium]|nr:hypothetical protein [Actinomycetota bacterium]
MTGTVSKRSSNARLKGWRSSRKELHITLSSTDQVRRVAGAAEYLAEVVDRPTVEGGTAHR